MESRRPRLQHLAGTRFEHVETRGFRPDDLILRNNNIVDGQLRAVPGFEIDEDAWLAEHETAVDRFGPLQRRGISGVVTGWCEQHGPYDDPDQGEA
jgi:hypothetical protein